MTGAHIHENDPTGATVWLTGLPGAGKTTLANALRRRLSADGIWSRILDGDDLRTGLSANLGFSREDRAENVRRIGEVAVLFAECGFVSIVASISPYRSDRDDVRRRHDSKGIPFLEIHVATPVEECERRDPKMLYRGARVELVPNMTGISDPYEPPLMAELVIAAGELPIDVCVEELHGCVLSRVRSLVY